MRTPSWIFQVMGATTLGVAFAACTSGSQPSITAPAGGLSGASPSLAFLRRFHHPPVAPQPFAVRPNFRKSWISPDTGNLPRLLFISDAATNTVDIFGMPRLNLRAQITGFTSPYGMCADARGRVWVADVDASEVLLYSRAGKLLKTLDVPGYPYGCAVNRTNGDLAVMDVSTLDTDYGDIAVFKDASGTPETYENPNLKLYYYFGGYDPSGNLYVSALTYDLPLTYELDELPSGGSALQTLNISGGTVYWPAMVQWYRQTGSLILGDQRCGNASAACTYTTSVSGSTATITGQTTLLNFDGTTACDVVQGTIAAFGERFLAGGNYDFCEGYTYPFANRWAFPAGGQPTHYNGKFIIGAPIGSAVSPR